ncbi:type VI secretion system Vgr family protein [Piscinibacterium candidicorallinum]|uniref:Type VI secretion system Vgr family protein n=1 Tax=Piscinibacterium candidicorallinum TaxID=1793872 RepID=A0ABV7GXP3_9BURK
MSKPFAQLRAPAGVAKSPLLFHRLEHAERLNSTQASTLQFLSLDAAVDLHGLLNQHLTSEVRLNLADDSVRHVDGIVAGARLIDQLGRYSRYEVELRPWLWFLSLTTDSRIFQDQTIPEILQAVFADHPIAKVELKLTHTYAKRPYTVQHRQSDLEFVNWLCELEGITYHFTHAAGSHTLVLTDSIAKHIDCPGYETVPFNAQVGKRREDEQSLLDWQPARQVASSQVVVSDYAWQAPAQPKADQRVAPEHAPKLGAKQTEIYATPGLFHKESREESEALHQAQVALEALGAPTDTYTGRTTARALYAGGCFTLAKHAQSALNKRHLITAHQLTAVFANYEGIDPDLLAKLAPELVSAAGGAYFACSIHAQPDTLPFRPARTTPRPIVPGIQTATVVGGSAGNGEIHTDEWGRVKVHFGWDRYGQRDGKDTCWLRVSLPWAGANWGSQFIPRIGQEVLVGFADGDPDAPIVIGRVNNGANRPTTFSGTGSLPGNQALAGFKSKEIGGGGYNQVLFDDTTGQVRAQVASTEGASQLNLGWLVHPRADQAAGEGEGPAAKANAQPRGQGFELRTDEWGAVRAAKGLLITTDGKVGAVGGTLDRHDLVRCLEESLKLAKQLTENAKTHQAATGADETGFEGIDLKPQEQQTSEVKGLGSGANNEEKATDPTANHLALHSPAGIVVATPKNLTVSTGEHADVVTGKNLQVTTGLQSHVHATTGIRHFAQSGGIHSIANTGKLLFQSQHDDTVINAEQAIHLTASQKHVLIEAKQHITFIESGGAYITLKGGNIEIGGPGNLLVKTAKYDLKGPSSKSPTLPDFPRTDCKNCLLDAMKSGAPGVMV